jgi:hypothetical protein
MLTKFATSDVWRTRAWKISNQKMWITPEDVFGLNFESGSDTCHFLKALVGILTKWLWQTGMKPFIVFPFNKMAESNSLVPLFFLCFLVMANQRKTW